jgi:hypothetical protein
VATATCGVHSIMMEKVAKAGEGGRYTPTPFHYIYHHVYEVVVYAPAERADILPLFLLYPNMYSVVRADETYF